METGFNFKPNALSPKEYRKKEEELLNTGNVDALYFTESLSVLPFINNINYEKE